MSNEHLRDDIKDYVLINGADVRGSVVRGSSIYLTGRSLDSLPRSGGSFVAGFNLDGGVRYFNANQMGHKRNGKAVLQIGSEIGRGSV